MKKLLTLFLVLPFFLFSQEVEKPNLYQVVNITVKDGQDEAFKDAVKSHNAKYHPADGLYHARLAYNLNGPDGGKYSWIMGPTNYTALDDRPGKGAHDDDWKMVSSMVEEFDTPTYWSLDHKSSYLPAETTPAKRLIWMYDIKSGQSARWRELIGKVKEVYEKKKPTETFIVVWNEFNDTKKGYDAAVIFAFDKWAWMDRKSNFSTEYEEVHGKGTWHNFLNEFSETTDGRVDWMRTFIK